MKRRLQTFWYSLKRSILDITYYNHIVKAPLTFSLKYFFVLLYAVLFFEIFLSALSFSFLLPKIPAFVSTAKERLNNFYPQDLVIKIENGQLRTNKKEPLYLDIPEAKTDEISHFITIDTEARAEEYKEYSTYVLVTRRAIVHPDPGVGDVDSYTVTSLERSSDETITYSTYKEIRSRLYYVLDRLHFIAPIVLILIVLLGPIFMSSILYLWNILYIGVLSLLLYFIAGVFKVDWKYQQVFQAGLHGATLPLILTTLLGLFGLYIPMFFTAAFLFWMVIMLSRVKETKG